MQLLAELAVCASDQLLLGPQAVVSPPPEVRGEGGVVLLQVPQVRRQVAQGAEGTVPGKSVFRKTICRHNIRRFWRCFDSTYLLIGSTIRVSAASHS